MRALGNGLRVQRLHVYLITAPPTVCEWFFRRAAALDAAGDSIEARVVRDTALRIDART